jgi:hypothetical protein
VICPFGFQFLEEKNEDQKDQADGIGGETGFDEQKGSSDLSVFWTLGFFHITSFRPTMTGPRQRSADPANVIFPHPPLK